MRHPNCSARGVISFIKIPFFPSGVRKKVRELASPVSNIPKICLASSVRRMPRVIGDGSHLKKMGINALYCKPNLSQANQAHRKYPYLLKGLAIQRSNQVWSTDITYIPMAKGFVYLCAVIDWHSRKVLAHRVSISMEVTFCIETLNEAIEKYGRPEIFNTDQGSQFTSDAFIDVLKSNGIQISMDGKGRWVDNVMVERLWRSVKYEEVYLKAYSNVLDAKKQLNAYFEFYNLKRPHSSLDKMTPDEFYYDQLPQQNKVA